MAVGIGDKLFLGLGEETTWGTSVARSKYIEINSEDLRVEEVRLVSPSLYRGGVHKDRVAQGMVRVAGGFVYNPQYEGSEKLWRAALHGVPVQSQPDVTNAPTVYQHTFSIRDVLSPYSLSLEVDRDIARYVAVGCKINSISWSQDAEDLMTCSVNVSGKQITTGSGSTPSFSSSPLIKGTEAVLTWGGTALDVEGFEITLDNGLGADRNLIGSRFIGEQVRERKIAVAGRFQAEFQSTTQYDDFRNATRRALRVVSTGDAIAGGQSYKFQIDVAVGEILDYNPTVDDQGRNVVDVQFVARRDNTDNELKITTTNTVSAV